MDQPFAIGDLLVYKNNQLVAFNKPPGLAVQPDNSGTRSLLELARIYLQGPVHLIHRIDRPASGLVLFARNEKALAHLNLQFRERTIGKTYLALVRRPVPRPEQTLVHYLLPSGSGNKVVAHDRELPNSKRAELHYRLLESGKELDLLQIDLVTGRQHQIRAQFAAVGMPIRGDNKYGYKRGNRDRSIQLHAWKLAFDHPVSGQRETVSARPPEENGWDAFSARTNG